MSSPCTAERLQASSYGNDEDIKSMLESFDKSDQAGLQAREGAVVHHVPRYELQRCQGQSLTRTLTLYFRAVHSSVHHLRGHVEGPAAAAERARWRLLLTYVHDFKTVLLCGLIELQAQICWHENVSVVLFY